jgi:hypothetical protein
MPLALQTLSDKAMLESLRENILSLGIADSADRVVNEIEKYW